MRGPRPRRGCGDHCGAARRRASGHKQPRGALGCQIAALARLAALHEHTQRAMASAVACGRGLRRVACERCRKQRGAAPVAPLEALAAWPRRATPRRRSGLPSRADSADGCGRSGTPHAAACPPAGKDVATTDTAAGPRRSAITRRGARQRGLSRTPPSRRRTTDLLSRSSQLQHTQRTTNLSDLPPTPRLSPVNGCRAPVLLGVGHANLKLPLPPSPLLWTNVFHRRRCVLAHPLRLVAAARVRGD